eukprot:gene3650-4547_t
MKSILFFALVAAFFTLALASDKYGCPDRQCNAGEVCVDNNNQKQCQPQNNCFVTYNQVATNQWASDKDYTLYETTIVNTNKRPLSFILFESADLKSKLRDNQSYWNIEFSPLVDTFFTLPSYVETIEPAANFTFGYIIVGKTAPQIAIKNHPCPKNPCINGDVCVNDEGCITQENCFVNIKQVEVYQWISGGKNYSLFEATITNTNTSPMIKCFLDTDLQYRLRDPQSIWCMDSPIKTILMLPPEVTSIAPNGGIHKFGYILEGNQLPILKLRGVRFIPLNIKDQLKIY